MAKIMFDRYDLDGSGAIEKAELAGLCAQLGRDLNPVQLDGVMAKLDTDGNGSIDYGELKRGLRRLNVAPKNLTSILAQQWEGRD